MQTKFVLFSLVSVLCFDLAVAETIATQNAKNIVNAGVINGNVSLGVSEEEIEKIALTVLAVYQHKSDQKPINTEQIKQPITTAISDLSKKGEVGSIAIRALEQGNTTQAKAFKQLKTIAT